MNHASPRNPSPERARGRPADVKSGELRNRLLDVAEEMFAEHGYDAVPVRQLADAAGVNPALIHYYFGSKQKLLFAVIDRAVLQLAEGLSGMSETGPEHIEDIVSLLFNMAARHPAMPPLVTREVLLSGGEAREVFKRDYAPKLGGALPGLIAKAQAAGKVSREMDPGALALMVLSVCLFPFISRNVAEPVLGVDYDEQGLSRYLHQLKTVISRGVAT
jgi:TetR/AcrR family transcriptional regulator